MKIKHWQGYGSVNAFRVKDQNSTLRIYVRGNHEWGLETDDPHTLFHWLVTKFDKSEADYVEWRKKHPQISVTAGRLPSGEEWAEYAFRY